MKLKIDYTTKADGFKNPEFYPAPRGVMVHSTATPGVMAQDFRDAWDRPDVGASVHAFVDDKEVVQCLPWTTRAGHAGGSANSTHLAFEICEPSGFYYSGGANMAGYDVAAQESYFRAAFNNAVELCAYLCKMFDIDPMADGTVICHSEGRARGIASNHADVMHWFPKHGENMDSFRAAVKAKLEESEKSAHAADLDDFLIQYRAARDVEDPFYAELADVPDYWRKEVEKLVETGAIKGDGEHGVGKRRSELSAIIVAARYVDNYFGNPE